MIVEVGRWSKNQEESIIVVENSAGCVLIDVSIMTKLQQYINVYIDESYRYNIQPLSLTSKAIIFPLPKNKNRKIKRWKK